MNQLPKDTIGAWLVTPSGNGVQPGPDGCRYFALHVGRAAVGFAGSAAAGSAAAGFAGRAAAGNAAAGNAAAGRAAAGRAADSDDDELEPLTMVERVARLILLGATPVFLFLIMVYAVVRVLNND